MSNSTKVSTATTLKSSVKDTLSFVNYHLNSGIDHMYLFFDDPGDESIPHLKNNEKLSLIKCDSDHWKTLDTDPKLGIQIKQRANATHALELARDSGLDWLLHLDVDELLYGKAHLPDYFDKIHPDIDVVRFPVMEAAPQKLHYNNPIREIEFFKFYGALPPTLKNFNARETDAKQQEKAAWVWNQKRRVAKLLGATSVREEDKFLLGHQNGKSAIRTSTKVVTVGIHYPSPKEKKLSNIAVSQELYLMHYDCLGFESWKQKWKKRYSGENFHDTTEHSRQRIELTSKIEEVLRSEESIEKLYKDLYYLSRYEMALFRALGLVKKIQIPRELFDK